MRTSIIIALCLAISACTTRSKVSITNPSRLHAARSAYVAFEGGRSQDVANGIEIALAGHGLKTTGGPRANCPQSADLLVTFEDHWTWDLTLYMLGLNVHCRDARDGSPVAEVDNFYFYQQSRAGTKDAVDRLFTASP